MVILAEKLEVLEAELYEPPFDRKKAMQIVGVNRTLFYQLVNLLIAAVGDEFGYNSYGRYFSEFQVKAIRRAYGLKQLHGWEGAMQILESEGI